MKKFIVLLRGINVGGHKKIPMADLRELLEFAKFENVKTYIQSGNISLFSNKSREIIEKVISDEIEKKFGFIVPILIKTRAEWAEIIAKNPFSGCEDEENYFKKLSVTFLREKFPDDVRDKIIEKRMDNEDVFFARNCLYLWCGDGFGKSKIATIISKYPYGTTRNWNSVIKINEL